MGSGARAFDPGLVLVGLITLLFVALGVPVVVQEVQGTDVAFGPPWLWPIVYAGFIAAYLATSALTESSRRRALLAWFIAQALAAIASVLLIHTGMGFVKIVLIFSAALSVYVIPRSGTALVILANTAAVVVSTPGVAEKGVNAAFYIVVQAVTALTVSTWISQERSQRQLAEAHVQLAAASALLDQSARAEERLRISRDLHDVAGHRLTALALELEIASHQADGDAAEHVRRARSIAKDLLAEVRDSVSQLRDERGSLRDALEHVITDISRPAVELSVDPGISADAGVRTAMVRAAQEALTNTIRHAHGATTLRITVRRDPESDALVLSASDDGAAGRDVTPGNGLRGLRERAEHLGGSAEFTRGPDGGFVVRMAVPAR
ncbi:ATP-binding protein [Microbacterium halophytorum]|uniref:ATP-binding protein n=1 Tax=Microbacterium halophytorum TaxID=2067568 RepID=UPI000CFB86BE|nr:histidine kinase [Microbacterium halophytorum]